MINRPFYNELSKLYLEVLERPIDESGYETYSNLLDSGNTLSDISSVLYDSEEFTFLSYRKQLDHFKLTKNRSASWDLIKKLKHQYPDNLRVGIAEANLFNEEFNFKRSAVIYERLLKNYPDNFELNIALINCLTELGDLENARLLIVRLSSNNQYISDPQFLRLCTQALDKKDIEGWEQLSINILNNKLDLGFIIKYINHLEDSGLLDQAIGFIDEVENRSKNTDLQIQITALFEKHRLENTRLLQTIKSKSDDIKIFKQRDSELLLKIESLMYESNNSNLDSWFKQSQTLFSSLKERFSQCYLHTHTNPIEACTLAKHIIGIIHDKTPFSLIRLGDGEGHFLTYNNKQHQEHDQQFIQQLWWGDSYLDTCSGKSEVISNFISAIDNADVIGISDYQTVLTFVDPNDPFSDESSNNNTCSRGFQAVNDSILHIESSHTFHNKILTSSFVHKSFYTWACTIIF